MTPRSFEASYEPLSPDPVRNWGRVAVLPWDAEIFGFPVAEYAIDDLEAVRASRAEVRQALKSWARSRRVELICCSVPGHEALGFELVPSLACSLVDFRICAMAPRLQAERLPPVRTTLRPAEPGDAAGVERIAATAFRFGRYHTDAAFPRELADLRYRVWIRNVLESPGPGSRVFVLGPKGLVNGFFHVEIRDARLADLRLGAVDVALESGIAGFSLYAGTLQKLKEEGVEQVTASVSAGNTAVMNLYAALGFRFSRPEAVYHWHAPWASHLVRPHLPNPTDRRK